MSYNLLLTKKQLDKMRACGIVDENALWYFYLRQEYFRRRNRSPKKKHWQVKEELAQEEKVSIDVINYAISSKWKKNKLKEPRVGK